MIQECMLTDAVQARKYEYKHIFIYLSLQKVVCVALYGIYLMYRDRGEL